MDILNFINHHTWINSVAKTKSEQLERTSPSVNKLRFFLVWLIWNPRDQVVHVEVKVKHIFLLILSTRETFYTASILYLYYIGWRCKDGEDDPLFLSCPFGRHRFHPLIDRITACESDSPRELVLHWTVNVWRRQEEWKLPFYFT